MINQAVPTPSLTNHGHNATGGITRGHSNHTMFPRWLYKPIPLKGKKQSIEHYLREGSLHTVCEEAHCPNRCECFANGTATFLIMGNTCTRNCLFCSIKHGAPLPLDPQEPERLCEAVTKMNLSYVVITMVTRDDLEDGGANHIAKTISFLKRNLYTLTVEVLVPDFGGSMRALATVLESRPDVFNHNIETVPSLYSYIRPEADYTRSLALLRRTSEFDASVRVKSGFMVGLGESEREVITLMQDLRNAHVSIVTIGQYLQPGKSQVPVKEFIPPEQFERYRTIGENLGFDQVAAGPFVRSSYHAEEIFYH